MRGSSAVDRHTQPHLLLQFRVIVWSFISFRQYHQITLQFGALGLTDVFNMP